MLLSEAEQKSRKYDRDTIRIAQQSMRASSTFIDAGAHAGTLLKKFVKIAPNGRGFAFEPIPELCDALRMKFPHISVSDVALGSSEGVATFRHLIDDPANSSLYIRPDRERNRTTRTIEVLVRKLDDCVPIDVHVDFIKVDVEGAELELLKGAERILTTDHPVVVFESTFAHLEEIGRFLEKFDMGIQILTDYLESEFRELNEVIKIALSRGEYYFVASQRSKSGKGPNVQVSS